MFYVKLPILMILNALQIILPSPCANQKLNRLQNHCTRLMESAKGRAGSRDPAAFASSLAALRRNCSTFEHALCDAYQHFQEVRAVTICRAVVLRCSPFHF